MALGLYRRSEIGSRLESVNATRNTAARAKKIKAAAQAEPSAYDTSIKNKKNSKQTWRAHVKLEGLGSPKLRGVSRKRGFITDSAELRVPDAASSSVCCPPTPQPMNYSNPVYAKIYIDGQNCRKPVISIDERRELLPKKLEGTIHETAA